MYLRDTLLCCAKSGLYRVHWSQEILDEAIRNLVKNEQTTRAKAGYTEQQMKKIFPEAMVEVRPEFVKVMRNHPKDRHVLAAAVVARAQVIVTSNLQDFQKAALDPFDVEAQHPDVFLTHLYDLEPELVVDIIRRQAQVFKRPPKTAYELLTLLHKQVPEFADRVQQHLVS